MVVLIVLAVVWLVLFALWVAAIVDASRFVPEAYRKADRSKTATVLLVVLTGWLGAIYYWVAIRREVHPHRDTPPTLPPGHTIDPSSYA